MKKLISLLLACTLLLSFAGCASKAPADESASSAESSSEITSEGTSSENGLPEDHVTSEKPSSEDASSSELPPIDGPAAEGMGPAGDVTPTEPAAPDSGSGQTEKPSGSTNSGSTAKPADPDGSASSSGSQTSSGTIEKLSLDAVLTNVVDASGAEFGSFFSSYSVAPADAGFTVGYDGFSGTFDEALAYGPAIGSIAFVMVLFRLAEGQDAAAFADDLRTNANPAKWICVQADFVDAEANGQTVLFLMASSEACPDDARTAMLTAFRGL